MSRREAIAAERAAAARPVSMPVAGRTAHPIPAAAQAGTTEASVRVAAPAAPHPRSANRPPKSRVRSPKVVRPIQPRKLGARIASVAAMGIVAAFTVALSLPAEALMSSSDVQAKQIAAAAAATGDDQVILAGGGTSTVAGESYDAESKSAYAAESGISQIEATFTNDPNGTVQWPFAVGVHIGDQYGSTAGRSSAHHGQDFNPGNGAPIQAIADGVVTFAEDGEGNLGVHMMITHQINGQTITSVYAHMSHGSMRFAVGDTVKVGQVIGNVGNTGYSTGPHLHFEIRLGGIDGAWTDPLVWLRANTN